MLCLVKMQSFCKQCLTFAKQSDLCMAISFADTAEEAGIWNEDIKLVSLLTAMSSNHQQLVSFLSYLSWYLIEHLLQLSAASYFQSQCLWVSGPSCRCPWNIVQVAYRTVSHVQFTIHDVLWYMAIIHSMCITQPLKTMLAKERIHSPGLCWLKQSFLVTFSPHIMPRIYKRDGSFPGIFFLNWTPTAESLCCESNLLYYRFIQCFNF